MWRPVLLGLVWLLPLHAEGQGGGGGGLRQLWTSYAESPLLDRWLEYAEVYEAHFPKPDPSAAYTMLEIGVQSGGSTRTWKQYYGPSLTYVGVDINPGSKRSHSPEEKIFIEIGSQTNVGFLQRLCQRYVAMCVHKHTLLLAAYRAAATVLLKYSILATRGPNSPKKKDLKKLIFVACPFANRQKK